MSTNRLERHLAREREAGRAGIAPYVTAGDGGLETTLAVLEALDRGGASCVELGVPFSDPIADGPILQAAAQRSLHAGTSLSAILEMVGELRARGSELPLALFSYANPLLKLSWQGAAQASAEAGIDAWLIPDMIPEEADAMRAAAAEHGIAPIFFVAPTSSDERIERATRASRGFLYAIGRVGVTGSETTLAEPTLAFLDRIRTACDLPLAVGFGLRSAEQVAAVTRHADLAIVGSAFVQRIHEAYRQHECSPRAAADEAALYLAELMQGLNR